MKWLVLLCAVCAVHCSGDVQEYGEEILTETGRVASKVYMPANHGSGSGFSTRGSVVFTSTTMPAKYAVVFECEHGTFAVEGGDDSTAHHLWQRLNENTIVEIKYREVFLLRASTGTRDLIDLDFVDAVAK